MEPNKQHISERQSLMNSVENTKPKGEVVIPALVCGMVGIVLTTILSLIGRYKGIDQILKESYLAEPFRMEDSYTLHGAWNWFFVLLLSFGISFSVLDSDKIWRRVMLFLLALVVTMMASPVFMMWDIFWSPVMVVVGLLWSWFCAFIYSVQHAMPCELSVPVKKVKPTKPVIPAKAVEVEEAVKLKFTSRVQIKSPDNETVLPVKKANVTSDPLLMATKYKPKE